MDDRCADYSDFNRMLVPVLLWHMEPQLWTNHRYETGIHCSVPCLTHYRTHDPFDSKGKTCTILQGYSQRTIFDSCSPNLLVCYVIEPYARKHHLHHSKMASNVAKHYARSSKDFHSFYSPSFARTANVHNSRRFNIHRINPCSNIE